MEKAPAPDSLAARLPAGTDAYVAGLLAGSGMEHPMTVRLSRPRRSKIGDHRPPGRGQPAHRISVNDDLNPYAFLTTLLHEIAHATTWEKHRRRVRAVKPHGTQWKEEFERLLTPVVACGSLPADIGEALSQYMRNPAAATCSDRRLLLALSRYDRQEPGRPRVEDLPPGVVFRLGDGRTFRMGLRLRTRYRCFERPSGREYRVHALSRVEVLEWAESCGGMISVPDSRTAGRRGAGGGARSCRRRAAADWAGSRSACS